MFEEITKLFDQLDNDIQSYVSEMADKLLSHERYSQLPAGCALIATTLPVVLMQRLCEAHPEGARHIGRSFLMAQCSAMEEMREAFMKLCDEGGADE